MGSLNINEILANIETASHRETKDPTPLNMSQFSYINDINSALGMDSEITKGPVPRWQKKMDASSQSINNSINTSKLSISYNGFNANMTMTTTANSGSSKTNNNKTPNKSGSGGTSNNGKKTPGKSPGRKTPSSKEGSKTPTGGGGGDRFIPSRANSNFELGHYMIKQVCDCLKGGFLKT